MPEPLILKIQADTQGVPEAVNLVNKKFDGLKLSSQKASSAVKVFANDIANAKDATDVASAALAAFTRILGSSIAATVFAAGAKTIYDAYSDIANAVDTAKKSLEEAFEISKRGGLAESFSDGVSQAKEFDKVADQINKKIKEINDSPLKNLIDVLTGSTDKMRETAKLAEEEAVRRREAASAAELQYQTSIQGATEEAKAIKEIEKALSDQLNQIDILKEGKTAANLTAIAEIKKEAAEQKFADEERKKSEKNLADVIKERSQNELKAYEAEAKARQDAQKIFNDFEAEKAKAHKEDLRRSADRISSLMNEMRAIQRRNEELAKGLSSLGGEIATEASRIGGSARGPGQRKTSFEIGMEKAAERARASAQRQFRKGAEGIAAERISARGETPDQFAIQREMATMQGEAISKKTMAPVEEYKKLQEEIQKNEDALKENSEQIKESTKAQSELSAISYQVTASFGGVDYSVNKMGEAATASSDSITEIGSASSASADEVYRLAGGASSLATIFDRMKNMEIQSIVTQKINTDSILLS